MHVSSRLYPFATGCTHPDLLPDSQDGVQLGRLMPLRSPPLLSLSPQARAHRGSLVEEEEAPLRGSNLTRHGALSKGTKLCATVHPYQPTKSASAASISYSRSCAGSCYEAHLVADAGAAELRQPAIHSQVKAFATSDDRRASVLDSLVRELPVTPQVSRPVAPAKISHISPDLKPPEAPQASQKLSAPAKPTRCMSL